jgi:hypothetical protein
MSWVLGKRPEAEEIKRFRPMHRRNNPKQNRNLTRLLWSLMAIDDSPSHR